MIQATGTSTSAEVVKHLKIHNKVCNLSIQVTQSYEMLNVRRVTQRYELLYVRAKICRNVI